MQYTTTCVIKSKLFLWLMAQVILLSANVGCAFGESGEDTDMTQQITLPPPVRDGNVSLEKTLSLRRSVRGYEDKPVTLSQVSQMLWAAQGVTDNRGFRTAPSAGALFPLEVYLVAGNVEELETGVYKYAPESHGLRLLATGDKRDALMAAALEQEAIQQAPAILVIGCVYERTAVRYGNRTERFVHIEAGHAGQNIALQAISLDLGTVMIGAFDDDGVQEVVGMKSEEQPLYIIPFGHPQVD